MGKIKHELGVSPAPPVGRGCRPKRGKPHVLAIFSGRRAEQIPSIRVFLAVERSFSSLDRRINRLGGARVFDQPSYYYKMTVAEDNFFSARGVVENKKPPSSCGGLHDDGGLVGGLGLFGVDSFGNGQQVSVYKNAYKFEAFVIGGFLSVDVIHGRNAFENPASETAVIVDSFLKNVSIAKDFQISLIPFVEFHFFPYLFWFSEW